MSRISRVMGIALLPGLLMLAGSACAGKSPASPAAPEPPAALSNGADFAKPDDPAQQLEVTADKSLEWYQDTRMYVARGNAKAVRGDMVVEADLLSAHERAPPPGANAPSNASGAKAAKPVKPPKAAPGTNGTAKSDTGGGDIDKMIAEGNVRITDPREEIFGDHAVDDFDKHVSVVTGNNLRYETEKETVTARDSLEYWEEKRIAVARGHAVAVGSDRHVEGDVLTAEFRDSPAGQQQLWKLTADGHVTVITKTDVSRGEKAVYDVARDVAIITGHVLITRADGTQLTGDVGEVDFKDNQSRLLNEGHGRVRALLPSKTTGKATGPEAPGTTGNAGSKDTLRKKSKAVPKPPPVLAPKDEPAKDESDGIRLDQ